MRTSIDSGGTGNIGIPSAMVFTAMALSPRGPGCLAVVSWTSASPTPLAPVLDLPQQVMAMRRAGFNIGPGGPGPSSSPSFGALYARDRPVRFSSRATLGRLCECAVMRQLGRRRAELRRMDGQADAAGVRTGWPAGLSRRGFVRQRTSREEFSLGHPPRWACRIEPLGRCGRGRRRKFDET